MAAILILSHNSVADGPMWTKVGRQMQNDMLTMTEMWNQKPKVKFQYGGRLFSETESTNISALD